MTDLVRFDYSLVPAAKDIASDIHNTEWVPKSFRGRPGAVLAAILTGQEANVGPMQAIAGFDVIEGAAKMKPELQRALVLAAGHEIWFDEHSPTKVVVCGRRSGSDKVTKVTWTLDDAKRAGLAGKKNWQTYPRQMLVARATGELCSLIFGDVVKGFSTGGDADVLEDDVPAATPVQPTDDAPEPVARRRRKAAPAPAVAPPPEPLPEDDIDDAEVVDVPSADPATTKQKQAIAAMCAELGWDDDKRRSFAGFIAGREIASAKELTIVEASNVIEALNEEIATAADANEAGTAGEGGPAPVPPSGAEPAGQEGML